MAKRIDDSTIEKINELYLEYGVKARVARELGVSPASVSKYIQPNYVKKADRNIEKTNFLPSGPNYFIEQIKKSSSSQILKACRLLSSEEYENMCELQEKEVFI